MSKNIDLKKNYGWFYVTSEKIPQKRKPGGQNNIKTKNICYMVIILLHYLDNIITIIIKKFQTLITSIIVKLIQSYRVKNLFRDG